MLLAFHSGYPGGIFENSPAFQRRDSGPKDELSPEGTIEGDTSPVPSGLRFLEPQPGVETPGYSRLSLRDSAGKS
jgi:hypothetical protein